MKTRILIIAFGLVLAGAALGQTRAQSDITIPPVVALTPAGSIQTVDTYIDRTKVHVVYVTKTSFTVPELLIFVHGNRSASTGLMAAVGQGSYDALDKAVKAINHDLELIHRQKVGLDVYNDLVKNHKRALKASLGLAKSLQRQGSADPEEVANLSKLVDQLESVDSYLKSIREILVRV